MSKRTVTLLLGVILLGIATYPRHVYLTIPHTKTTLTHFDTLIVLGYPSNPDGARSPEQRERVLEAVREHRQGIAPHINVLRVFLGYVYEIRNCWQIHHHGFAPNAFRQ